MDPLIEESDIVLITGANGFIGTRVIKTLLNMGFLNLRCFTRHTSDKKALNKVLEKYSRNNVQIYKGDLTAKEDCEKACKDVAIIFHLAAGMNNDYNDVYLDSVVATVNLLNAAQKQKVLKRFINVSSISVYSIDPLRTAIMIDETCDIEENPRSRGDSYTYGKVKQEKAVLECNKKYGLPYVIMRPGVVYGPGKTEITGRVGVEKNGFFLNFGRNNKIPFTYVDNCAEAIILAGIAKGVEGEIFNVVDGELPTSSQFLKMYKTNVKNSITIYVPKVVSYLLCYLSEKYYKLFKQQVVPSLNLKRWASDWKGNRYSDKKIKKLVGWKQKISTNHGLNRYFKYCKKKSINGTNT